MFESNTTDFENRFWAERGVRGYERKSIADKVQGRVFKCLQELSHLICCISSGCHLYFWISLFFLFFIPARESRGSKQGRTCPQRSPVGHFWPSTSQFILFYCLQTTLHFLRQQNSLFFSNFPENQILTFWHMMFKLLTCDQTRRMLSHNLLFCFIWHMFWDWANRLQMFTLFYIPAGSSVHPKSVFSHNSFCCWQHFFWWIMGLDVSLATRHRRCFSNWLIEFIIRYWKREKASKTSAKADWSQKLCSLCKMHKRRFSNWASPHFLAVPRPKYGGWWILGKSGNCANPAKSPTATKTLQSCWLHSTDCYRNIQNGRRLSFLLKVVIFFRGSLHLWSPPWNNIFLSS